MIRNHQVHRSTALQRPSHPGSKKTPTPTDVGSRADASTAPNNSACPSSKITKTTPNLSKITQSDFSTPGKSDNRAGDSDNMATDDDNSVGDKGKNPQDSHDMELDEETDSDDEDYYGKTLVSLLKGKGYTLTKDFRKKF